MKPESYVGCTCLGHMGLSQDWSASKGKGTVEKGHGDMLKFAI